MNHTDVVEKFATKAGVTKLESDRLIKALADVMEDCLKVAGDSARFDDIGTFKVIHRASRGGKNPRTKEDIIIPAKNVILFRASKQFLEKANVGK